MGTWGPGSLQNDWALDWLGEFAADPSPEALRDALTLPSTAEPDTAWAEAALAAGEVVAALGGREIDGFEAELLDWTRHNAPLFTRPLREAARAAVDVIADRSELATFWRGSDDYGAWRAELRALRSRLRKPR